MIITLIYSQNKNMGLDKKLTAFLLKTQYFPFTNITQNQFNQQYSSKLNPTQPQNSFTTKTKLFLSTFRVFPNIKITKDEARVLFSYLSLFKSPFLSCLITNEQEVGKFALRSSFYKFQICPLHLGKFSGPINSHLTYNIFIWLLAL